MVLRVHAECWYAAAAARPPCKSVAVPFTLFPTRDVRSSPRYRCCPSVQVTPVASPREASRCAVVLPSCQSRRIHAFERDIIGRLAYMSHP